MKKGKKGNKEAAEGKVNNPKSKGKRTLTLESEDETQEQVGKPKELQEGQIMFTQSQDSEVIVIEDKSTEEKREVQKANEDTPVTWSLEAANKCDKNIPAKKVNSDNIMYMSEFDTDMDESLMLNEASFVESIVETTRQIQALNMAAGGPTITSTPKKIVKSLFNPELSTMFQAPLEADKKKDILKIYVKAINIVDVVFGISKLRLRISETLNKEIIFSIYRAGDIYGVSTIKLNMFEFCNLYREMYNYRLAIVATQGPKAQFQKIETEINHTLLVGVHHPYPQLFMRYFTVAKKATTRGLEFKRTNFYQLAEFLCGPVLQIIPILREVVNCSMVHGAEGNLTCTTCNDV